MTFAASVSIHGLWCCLAAPDSVVVFAAMSVSRYAWNASASYVRRYLQEHQVLQLSVQKQAGMGEGRGSEGNGR